MNQTVPLYIVLLVFGIAGAGYVLFRLIRSIEAATRSIRTASEICEASGTKALTAMARIESLIGPASESLKANLSGVPKLLEAVAQVGTAQLEIMQRQRAAEMEAKKNPFGKGNAPMPPRDVEAANLEDEVNQLMRSQGMSREEALLRMNPANAGSVWDGDNLFRGWK